MTIQIRRDLALTWSTVNPVLAAGQLGYETNTNKLKVGDGATVWTALAYFGAAGTGTVTSVALSMPTGFSVAGSPITTNGTLAVTTTLNGYIKGNGSGFTASATVATADLTGVLAAAQHPALTGDVTNTVSTLATTIAAGVVTNAKLANVATATFKGRVTAATGVPEDLTGTQATTLLDVFSSTLKGLTPSSGGGTANFLRADGTWTAPAGGGTVTTVSVVTANGVSGTVATATTTPAITLTLGAVTPTSVAASGAVTGSNLSGTNTGDQTITLTGNVTGTGTGSFVATIPAGTVTLAQQANVATGTVFYRKTAATGVPEVQTLATLKTDLGLTGTNSGDQTITLTGDVTGTGAGSFVATIAAASVTLAKQANLAANSIIGNNTGVGATPLALTAAQVRTLLNVADGATANSSDAVLLARANHTGTQSVATILSAATDVFFGRDTAGAGAGEEIGAAAARAILNVANGATANSSDAFLLARANHTGTQVAATISDFASTARAETEAELLAGANITITPGGAGATRTLTLAAAGGGGSGTSIGLDLALNNAMTCA